MNYSRWPTWEEVQKRTRTLRTRSERVDYVLSASTKELYDAVHGFFASHGSARYKPKWVRSYVFELKERGAIA